MNMFNAEKTIVDISLLYELALSSGQSLDPHTNCDLFIQRLLNRKNFSYAAVWIRENFLGNELSTKASLIYSYPDRYSLKKVCEADNLLFDPDGDTDSKNYTLKEETLSLILDQSILSSNSVVCYKLMDFGVIILAADYGQLILEEEVIQLYQVLSKFAISLQGCLSNQRLLSEMQERRKANELLEENEKKLKQAQSFASMGTWEFNIADNRLYWSEECGALFGLVEEQFPESFEGFLEYVYPADRDYVKAVNRPVTELKEAVPLRYEHRIVKHNGGVRWVREEADLILNNCGEAVKLLGMVIDITVQKEAAEKITKANAELEIKVQERTRALQDVNIALSDEVNERRLTEGKVLRLLEAEKLIADVSALFVLSSVDKMDQCINETLMMTGQFHDVDRSYIFLISEDGLYLKNTHEWCAPEVEPVIEHLQNLDAALFPWWLEILESKKIINIPCVEQMPPEAAMEKEALQAQGNQSVLVVPLIAHDKLLGFIGFDSVKQQKIWADEQVSLLKVVADITGSSIVRKRYEQDLAEEKELLSVTLRSIAEGLVVVDLEQRVINLNRRAEELTGWSSREAEGSLLSDVIKISSGESNTVISDPLQVIEDRTKSGNLQKLLLLVDRTGGKKNITAVVAEIKDGSDRVRGTVLAFQDITDRLKVEAQLALAEKLKSIGQLAAGIAHEINTPMQYIGDNMSFLNDSFEAAAEFIEKLIAYFKSLDRYPADQQLKELVKLYDELDVEYRLAEGPLAARQTLEGVERVSRIVGAMRGFARSGSTGMKGADLNAAINDTLVVSRNEWKYFAEVLLELDPELPEITCEIDQINQVLLNLIINAAQSIETAVEQKQYERGEIRLVTRVEAGFAVIKIADNGVGINPDIKERIFDPFFTTKDVGRGSGQGLMIAHDIIVNRHGGLIDVSSDEGKGAVFWVKLPLKGKDGETSLQESADNN